LKYVAKVTHLTLKHHLFTNKFSKVFGQFLTKNEHLLL